MGGKGGGGDSGAMQPVQSTIDTQVKPVDLTHDQQLIDVQRAARDATAPSPTSGGPGASTGDIAASTLNVPDFLTGQQSLQPSSSIPKSKLVTTDDSAKSSKSGST
jgi:hypothetical protein